MKCPDCGFAECQCWKKVPMEIHRERSDAIALANKLLDEPNCDPDDDLRMLSRQLLRGEERIAGGALTPNGIALLTLMNGDYRRKVIKALEGMKPEWDHIDGAEHVIDTCITAVRTVPLTET